MYLALDKTTNDLILPEGGGVTRIDKGRFVVQQVQSKLRTFQGEWELDPTIGLLNNRSFDKPLDLFTIETRARAIILGTDGVLSITSMDASIEKATRKVLITFEALTIYGEISLEVPWK